MEIKHTEEENKFYAELEKENAVLKYEKPEKGIIDFKSTYVPKDERGKGIATDLVKHGLEYAEKYDYKVIPTCSFVEFFIDNHESQYGQLLADSAKENDD